MCTNYTLRLMIKEVVVRFQIDNAIGELPVRDSNHPTQMIAVITENSPRSLELMKWGLIPSWAKDASIGKKMLNARSETIAEKPSFRSALSKRRCLIPADRFDYPNWESGKNEWWTFRRGDGQPWHLAGIWNAWTSPETGEVFESYSTLTQHCDAHPLLNRFHKPEPDLPPDKQDKRTVVPLEVAEFRTWLMGTSEEAAALVRLRQVELYDAGPA